MTNDLVEHADTSRQQSPRQQQMQALTRAGRRGEVHEKLEGLCRQAGASYASIRNDPDHSDSWKAEALRAAHRSVTAELDEWLERNVSSALRSERADYAAVFGVDGLPGDVASLAISRRDAADRVAAAGNRSDLVELLKRATYSGDEVLARAVAERAFREQDVAILNDYLEDRHNVHEPAKRLWSGSQRQGDTMEFAGLLLGLRP